MGPYHLVSLVLQPKKAFRERCGAGVLNNVVDGSQGRSSWQRPSASKDADLGILTEFNDRSGSVRCTAVFGQLHLQRNAVSATAVRAKGGCVPDTVAKVAACYFARCGVFRV